MSTPRKLILLACLLIGFILGTITAAWIQDVFAASQTHELHLLNTRVVDGWIPEARVITEPEDGKLADWPLVSEYPLCLTAVYQYTDQYKNTVTVGVFSGSAPCN